MDHFHWADDTFDQVHWNSTLSAICGLSVPVHTIVIKLSFKLLPIGFRLQQRQAHMPTQCPSCEEPMEDDWHWLTCDSRAAWRLEQQQLFKLPPCCRPVIVTSTTLDSPPMRHALSNRKAPFSIQWARIQDDYIAEQNYDGKIFSSPACGPLKSCSTSGAPSTTSGKSGTPPFTESPSHKMSRPDVPASNH